MKGHVIFDFDGTLVDSFEAILLGIQKLMHELTGTLHPLTKVREMYTPDIDKQYQSFGLAPMSPSEKMKNLLRFGEIARGIVYDYQLFPGLLQLLENLKQEGYRLSLWTARDRQSTLEILNRVGIMPFFQGICCADDARVKPAPDGLLKLAEGHDKEKVVVIGDSSMDCQGARSYGGHFIAALWCPRASLQWFQSEGVEELAYTPVECQKAIARLLE